MIFSLVVNLQLPFTIWLFAPRVNAHERPINEAGSRIVHRSLGDQRRSSARRTDQVDVNVAASIGRQVDFGLHMLQVLYLVAVHLKRKFDVTLERNRPVWCEKAAN